ncbi:MAG: Gfo/Idh/MocA family oxidoreductase [Armatimonadota bacterium]
MSTVRIGFVGVGGIAHAHLDALSQIENVALVAFCDVDASRAEATATRFSGRAYTDFEAMLRAESLDALYVCVPPHAHEGIEERAAEKGIHLFVEKPVARTLQRARQIEAAIQRAGVLSSVGYHFRYYSATDRARERLQGLPIGMVIGYWHGGMPGAPWWRQHALSGGQMVEQTTHIVDLARYLVGEIVEVHAYFAQGVAPLPYPESDVSEAGVVALRFANGAVGVISNTCMLNVPGEVALKIYTPNRLVELSWGKVIETEANRREEYTPRENPYLSEDRAFIEAIRTGNRDLIRSPYADAVRTLAVTLAADESARTGKPIKVADYLQSAQV